MQHFYVFNFNKKKRFFAIVLLGLITAFFIIIEPARFLFVFSKDQQTALTKGNIDENQLALTFNISWGEEKVFDILNVLKEQDVRATFFVSGEWAERHPQIIEKITEDKHELGMLGYRYKSYLEQDIEQVRKDISYAKQVFEKLGFDDINYIRPPSGHFNKEIVKLAEDNGLEVIHWSVNPNDWENPGTKEITDHVLKEVKSGDIVLLHASDSAKQTANALQSILPHFKEEKLTFVTISELINGVQAKEKLVE
ncbi:polysaccharide deacetylase family sporulation protein PdaB [Pseudogracilibacillus sp. SO30301A]|uniref:polysaccharide deacetylase family sporulation protein PdaB n=1 Tax=Pseudogracilibacillus sp. SO30301A TaxID=3098291 RepID=UPI00300E09D6